MTDDLSCKNINNVKNSNLKLNNITTSSNVNQNVITSNGNIQEYPHQRKKKTKPLSMNETLLNKIVRETVKKQPVSRGNVPTYSQIRRPSGDTQKTNGIFNGNNSMSITKESKKGNLLVNQSRSSNNFSLNKSINKKAVTLGEIPLPNRNLNKIPSNGLETTISQYNKQMMANDIKTEMSSGSLSNINSFSERDFNMTSSSCSTNLVGKEFTNPRTFHKTDPIKLNEELLEYKLNNSKLKNEISILSEKIKTLKHVGNLKNSENEFIKNKYSEMIDEYKRENEKLKKTNNEYINIIESNNRQNSYLKSTLSVLIELFEIFVSPRFSHPNNLMTRQSANPDNISASYSIDIYDSYNNDDDKSNTLVEQIQGLLVAKLMAIKKNLGIDLDKEIEKVKSWNIKVNSEMNVSNLAINLKMSKINDSAEKSDLFDLSTSNQFIMLSPKFNSEMSLKIKEPENSNNFSVKKEEDNQILNDSFLKDLKQNDSFSDDKNGSLITILNKDFNPFSNSSTNDRKGLDLDCSLIDLNVENKSTPTSRMMFNDNPTEFNIEMNPVSNQFDDDEPNFNIITTNNNLNTTFNNEGDVKTYEEVNVPIILKSSDYLGISFDC